MANTVLEIWKEKHDRQQDWLNFINKVPIAREVYKCKACLEHFEEEDLIGGLCEYCNNELNNPRE